MNKIVSLKHVINVMNRIFKDEMHAKKKCHWHMLFLELSALVD